MAKTILVRLIAPTAGAAAQSARIGETDLHGRRLHRQGSLQIERPEEKPQPDAGVCTAADARAFSGSGSTWLLDAARVERGTDAIRMRRAGGPGALAR